MERRRLGRTGIEVSALTFGCGAVGGLMTKGDPADQERAVSLALAAGIDHFDTAPQYGNGTSETNLGRILARLKPAVVVSTKVRIPRDARGRIGEHVARAIDESLGRLGRASVDLYQLHNTLAAAPTDDAMTADEVLRHVVPALDKVRAAGKARFIGFTAIGDTSELVRLIDSRAFDSAQVPYNVLAPSAAAPVPARYPGQDFDRLLHRALANGVGTIGIRVLAGGALSGSEARHPLGTQTVAPIGSGSSYATDVARARRLAPMIAEGHAGSLPELALRFALSCNALSTTEIGLATVEQLEAAVAAVARGPLPDAALVRLAELQAGFAGEAR